MCVDAVSCLVCGLVDLLPFAWQTDQDKASDKPGKDELRRRLTQQEQVFQASRQAFAAAPLVYSFVGEDSSAWSFVVDQGGLTVPWSNEPGRALSGDVHWETELPVAI
jgi:hypothetical protein